VGSGRGGQRPILSERELIVLALLPSMLSLDDIAADLTVSVTRPRCTDGTTRHAFVPSRYPPFVTHKALTMSAPTTSGKYRPSGRRAWGAPN
jgi:hypothetical protein